MRNVIIGSFVGFLLAAAFLAACGGGGGDVTSQANVEELQQQVAELRSLLQHVTRNGNDLYITGANLHVMNGTGTTPGDVNGLGNVIIGYNEERSFPGATNFRTGSHMLVVGRHHNYSSYGGIVSGGLNTTSGECASVFGSYNSEASGRFATVTGGTGNTASGEYASVSGGSDNNALHTGATCSGGVSQDTTGTSDHRP